MKHTIIGYSGHAYVVIESARSIGISFDSYCDRQENNDNPYDLLYLGDESAELLKNRNWFIGIGDNSIRERVFHTYRAWGACLTIIDPSALVSSSAQTGTGTFIARNVSVNALADIGTGVILNTSSVVEHECMIGDFSHIAPGAVLAGNVTVGKGSFIGANSVVKEGVNIGDNVIIGAGSVVIKDVPDGCTVVGNPGRIIKRK